MLRRDKIWSIFFVGFLVAIFITEGFGIPKGHLLASYLALLMPFSLLILDLISGRQLRIPVISTCLLLLYLIFVATSTLFGVSIENSFGTLLYVVALFLVFVSVFNHKDTEELVVRTIIILGLSFIAYSLLLLFSQTAFLVPENGYQFVYSKFGSHNHLGDFLVLALIAAIYKCIQRKSFIYLGLIAIFSIFLFTSFSRSAYLSFIIAGGVLVWSLLSQKETKILSAPVVYLLSITMIASVLFFAVVTEASSLPLLGGVNNFLEEKFDLKPKTFLSRREDFAGLALKSLQQNPFTGVGVGNFVALSTPDANAPFKLRALSSHNIFLDILSESGILALISFLMFLIFTLKDSLKKRGLLFFLVLGMLVNFQTDYTHTLISFYALFFILLALNTREKTVDFSGLTAMLILVGGLAIGGALLLT